MKNLYQPGCVDEVKARIARLRPDSPRQWGKMDAAQALAHCALSLGWACGDTKPDRLVIGRIIGGFIRPKVMGDDEPLRRNSPSAPSLIITNARDLAAEQARVATLLDRFVAAGPAGCTTHPHSFFGRLTPKEWAILMYKHLDHHLRQFSV
ncbi:MAG TPA: DUF1569 domain-containing protein [Terracidiphilus sp.]|jgi:hypothetical protein|nr:DUF1569 domain-containing protein [Terracidiphilus sp.]